MLVGVLLIGVWKFICFRISSTYVALHGVSSVVGKRGDIAGLLLRTSATEDCVEEGKRGVKPSSVFVGIDFESNNNKKKRLASSTQSTNHIGLLFIYGFYVV